MLSRGGTLTQYLVRPDGDETWSADDWGRAMALEARWTTLGVSEEERRRYIPCAVLLAKFPGIVYSDNIMKRLDELSIEKIKNK